MTPPTEKIANATSDQLSSITQDNVDREIQSSLNLSDYVLDKEPDQKIVQNIQNWASQLQEGTRTNLAMMLAKFLGVSLLGTFILIGAAAFDSKADKAFIKELIPQVISPQITLLGVALGYYFGVRNKED